MSKSPIAEQIEALEAENLRLKNIEKLVEKLIQNEFGTNSKNIHKIIKNYSKEKLDFAEKIASFYGLESAEDYNDFLEILCSEKFAENFRNSSISDF